MRDFDPYRNPYQILGINRNCSSAQIRQAYYRLALHYHPDRNPAPDALRRMQDVNWAYSVLSDPNKRAYYDAAYNQPRPAYTNPRPNTQSTTTRTYTRSYAGMASASPRRQRAPVYGKEVRMGYGLFTLFLLLIQAFSGLSRPSRSSYSYNYSIPTVMLYSINTPVAVPTFEPGDLLTEEEFRRMSAAVNPLPEPIVPGSLYWQMIDYFLADYHLTTPEGLSDEVVAVNFIPNLASLVVTTRSYGSFRLNIWLIPYMQKALEERNKLPQSPPDLPQAE